MKFLRTLFLFSLAATAAAAPSLDQRLRGGSDGWVAYTVPKMDGVGSPCCFDHENDRDHQGCSLDGHNWYSGDSDRPAPPDIGGLTIYAHRHGGGIDRVRALAASCAVREANAVQRLDDVTAADSVGWLRQWIGSGAQHDEAESALAAIALHAGDEATAALDALSDGKQPMERRKNALFWLGQARGREGAKLVERAARGDGDASLREHAVFALSQSKAVDGYVVIHDIALHDASSEVRSQSLFWMAQMQDKRAADDIRAAVLASDDAQVREQGVFALSQLHPGGDAALIALLRGKVPREVKEKAMFWLGQSGSDEAIAFLDQVLAAPAR